MNELNEMFKKQVELQTRLGTFPLKNYELNNLIEDTTQEFINIQSLALIDEVMESLRETPWKPWKKNQLFNEENYKEELVDVWHFLINLTLASGMDSDELFKRFINKNKVNHKRQDEGY